MASERISMRVQSVTYLADGINAWELVPVDGGALPPFTAGAHIDLELPGQLMRSYSLTNDQRETHRYVIAVALAAESRGGSAYIHEHLRPGSIVSVSPPRNNLPLVEDVPHSILIAGGIGVTPLLSMIRRLEELGRSWELHYSTRTRRLCAYLSELEQIVATSKNGRATFNFDHEPGGSVTDIAALVARAPQGAHLYCCGPLPMLAAFERATKTRNPSTCHVEYFTPKAEASTDGGFRVILARSKVKIDVQPGQTILDAILAARIDVPYACREGTCATCETKVLSGIPVHRDSVLTEEERTSGETMMICCSGAATPELTLDI